MGWSDFNSYGARRGNHEVMIRGTFANIRLKNQLVPNHEGFWTRHFPSSAEVTIFDAAMRYAAEGVPLIVIQRQLGHADLAITSVYLRGIDNTETIDTVHERPAPMIPATAGLLGT